jgi:hypothetical protein
LLGSGIISTKFKEIEIFEFSDACEWIRKLPYKRNSNKTDPLIVIKEKCGTCSSKHEVIKRLSVENNIQDCRLILCIFKMSSYNTPKIKSVLEKYGLDFIPEAHTYIRLNGESHDYTFPDSPENLYLKDVVYEEKITADQIEFYKTQTHKRYIKRWIKKDESSYSLKEIWAIREACISALS